MSGMSVNEVPGWLVTMVPSGIGVPVAFTPGLVPHCDVFTAPLDEPPDGLLLVLLLPQPAASRPIAAASATAARARGVCSPILTVPHLLGKAPGYAPVWRAERTANWRRSRHVSRVALNVNP